MTAKTEVRRRRAMIYTDRARLVVNNAKKEAKVLGHHYIGTEHLLLGLLADEHSIAARVLRDLGLSADQVRAATLKVISPA